jgi:hypothetical protein
MKLKIKANKLTRTVDGVKTQGYYGRVITNGTKTFGEIAKESARNTTLHPKEAELAANLLLDAITERIKEGYIIDLGPIGKLYPAVSSKWDTDPENLMLSEMQPRVNYRPSDDIAGAVRSASLAWATAEDEKEGTETPDDDNQGNQGTNTGTGGNTGGGGDLTP